MEEWKVSSMGYGTSLVLTHLLPPMSQSGWGCGFPGRGEGVQVLILKFNLPFYPSGCGNIWCFWANGPGFREGAGEPPQYSVWGQLLTPSPVSMPVSGHSEGQFSICDGIHGPSSLDGGSLN